MPETDTDRPLLSDNFDRALLLATDHHRQQLRKGTAIPYEVFAARRDDLGPRAIPVLEELGRTLAEIDRLATDGAHATPS
jgi:hypothetical protein